MKSKILIIGILMALGFNTLAQISGTVTDLNSLPISNHLVFIFGDTTYSSNGVYDSTFTSANGAYSFNNLPNGAYFLQTRDCNNMWQSSIVIGNNGTANFQICTTTGTTCAAAFASVQDTIVQNLVHFNNQSVSNPPTNYFWDFGDGNTSTQQNPSHTYANSGTYTVTLSISSANCSDSISNTVVVNNTYPPCSAAFGSMQDTTVQNVVHFYNQSVGNPTSFFWDFGDGNTSTQKHPSHTYANSGTYTVSLSISSANCSDSTSSTIVVNSGIPCNAYFNYFVDANNTLLVHFNDISSGNPTSFLWNFGDGNTSTQQNPSHTYSSSGNYTVTLSINSTNCQSTTSQTLNISPNPIIISGMVLDSLNQGVSNSFMKLIDLQGNIVRIAFSKINGSYSFYNVTPGSYKILAMPDTNNISKHAATYLGNTTIWANADTITVSASLSQQNIHVLTFGSVSGAGSISGNVGNGAKAGLPNVLVNLLDNNLNPITSDYTDSNGDYSFSNLAFGTYKIWVEIPGKTTIPISVTLASDNNDSRTNDFIVNGSKVLPITLSINKAKSEMDFSLYPNPVENTLNIKLNNIKSQSVDIIIYDLSGKLIKKDSYSAKSTTDLIRLNVDQIEKGSYILRIQESEGLPVQRLFNKM